MISKEKLIEIIDTLYSETDLLKPKRYGNKYDFCKGCIRIEYSHKYNGLYSKLKRKFEELGYSVKHDGFNYMKIYYTNPEEQLNIFEQFK